MSILDSVSIYLSDTIETTFFFYSITMKLCQIVCYDVIYVPIVCDLSGVKNLGHQEKSKENLANTLKVTFSTKWFWKKMYIIFVLMTFSTFHIYVKFDKKTMSTSTCNIIEKKCKHSRGHFSDLMVCKISMNNVVDVSCKWCL